MWQNLRVYGQCSYIRCLQFQMIFSFRDKYTVLKVLKHKRERSCQSHLNFFNRKTIVNTSALFYFLIAMGEST